MPLADLACRGAKPADSPYKLSDAGGLFLLVQPNGSRLWRLAYRFHGKQKTLALGAYPIVSLALARDGRDKAKALLQQGIDPSADKQARSRAAKVEHANTFRAVAEELIELDRQKDTPKTIAKKEWHLSLVYPKLADRPVSQIRAAEMLEVLREIERRGLNETARRVRALCRRVFQLAIISERASINPCADLAGVLVAPKVKHHAAITEPKALGALLRAIDGMTEGQASTRAAMKLAPLVFVRPGELRQAEWSEFNLQKAVWDIPAARMKMPRPHSVPLSKQAIAILNELKQITGNCRYLFPQARSWHRPISDGTLNAMLRRLGYDSSEHTPHGFRSSASTTLNESRLFSSDAIELQLAHQEQDDVRAAYNRAQLWDERVRLVQWLSDHYDELNARGRVVALRA